MSINTNNNTLNEILKTINKLPNAKEEQEKSIDITESGTTEVTPDDDKVLNKVTVNVDIPLKDEQSKTIDITENGTITVTPDDGVVWNEVTVNAAVEGGESLPDWDDNSPIVASGRSYETSNVIWELTEKGTFKCKVVDPNAKGSKDFNFGLGGSALSQIPLDYQAIASKIKQIYFGDGIKKTDIAYAVNCIRVRYPNTLIERPFANFLSSVIEYDASNELNSRFSDYQFSTWFSLEKVKLATSLVTIPTRCFGQCYSLKEINLENVTTFKNACFTEDFSLNSDIVFNTNLISIEVMAFYRTRIKSVKYQNSVDNLPTIANNAFGQCRELKAIFCPWAEGAVANANGGAPNATMYYNVTYDENGNPIDENGNPIVLEV